MDAPSTPVRRLAPEEAWYRLLGLPVLAALAVGIGAYGTGAPLWRSIAIAATIGLTVWLLLRPLSRPQPEWPAPPLTGAEWGRTPRMWDVPGLDAALDRPRYMSRRVLIRIAAVVEELLARQGLTLDSQQADHLLGRRAIQLLTDSEAPTPSTDELSRLIGAVTTLADSGNAGRPLPVAPALLPTEGRRRRRPRGSRDAGPNPTSQQTTDRRQEIT